MWAEKRGLAVAKPADFSEINKHLLEIQPQLVITSSYGKLIPPELLHGPRFGWLNVHYSLLPKWRGAAPVQWSLINGDEETGISIFKLDKGMDTGPIYLQVPHPISEGSTTHSLLNELRDLSGRHIMDVVAMIAKAERPKPQPTMGISLAPKISNKMGEINWKEPSVGIVRLSQALQERPGIYTQFRGEKLGLIDITLCDQNLHLNPGEITSDRDNLFIGTVDLAVTVKEVIPAGKKRMKASDFARGARIVEGEHVG